MKHSVKILTTAMAIVLGGLTQAKAEEGVSHYEALPSETLAEAVENFVTYNDKVQEVLSRETLSVADMEEIHQFTYTLEIALAINQEFGIELRADDEANKRVFATLRSLTDYVGSRANG